MQDLNNIKVPSQREHLIIKLMVFIGICSVVNFLYWFFQPEYRSNPILYGLLSITIIYAVFKILYMWYHYINISAPKLPKKPASFSVDIFTTFFPGEPYDMIIETLTAIQKITYPHTAYLCDEANDPYLKKICGQLGVIHITRNNRKDAKAGNINNALQIATGEICVILDPDHIPQPNFLDAIIPHFNDPKIGFVQIVQSYYNLRETLVAKGAAEQTFQFYGPMMMTMNSYGTVNAIGANCTFRRAALDSIEGHAPGLAEDMHTAMLLYAKGWKSVYVPLVLAKGLAPSNLTAYYKQQLKWARGTFELLFKVYPKVYTKFTLRQKIHYALSPLHYLVGIVYFINFLIPILSLFFSRSPWNGNILFFGFITLPVIISAVIIRVYIQKWVIEKEERGFHLIGGILQITTWWVYFLGFLYTILGKKIPYLPTPKGDDENSNFKLILPNIIIGFLSLFAILYGLNRDFTPFMAIMALFAFLNAFFMFFSIYLASRTSNRNRIMRSSLQESAVSRLVRMKHFFAKVSNGVYKLTKFTALPLLIMAIAILQIGFKKIKRSTWEDVVPFPQKKISNQYLGIFHPAKDDGISDLNKVAHLEKKEEVKFDIVSLYVAWGDSITHDFPIPHIRQIHQKNAIPMISWEPWASTFKQSDTISELKSEKRILHYIGKGHFDTYIKKVALQLKASQKPVFLRFAHEFDNPSYPWSNSGDNTPLDFKKAWIHIYKFFNKLEVTNVVWVWNPWKSKNMYSYYPGDRYVDWIGVTGLNYGYLNQTHKSVSFYDLYKPYHDEFKKHTKKPVMISEFGSLKLGARQQEWISKAMYDLNAEFQEVNAIVLFNTNFDKNIPPTKAKIAHTKYLNWQISDLESVHPLYQHQLPKYLFDNSITLEKNNTPYTRHIPISSESIKGVGYKKGQNWKANHYVLSREYLEKDFRSIQELGMNSIRYEHGVYDKNVLAISKEAKLNLLYSFWIPKGINFISDTLELAQIQKKIMNTIRELKSERHIIGWNIGNTVLKDISDSFNPPIAEYQRIAYFNWLQKLLAKIKKIDPHRSLILEITASKDNFEYFKQLSKQQLSLDYFGFKINGAYDSIFQFHARKEQIPFLVTDITAEDLMRLQASLKAKHVFIKNWQDQWETGKITFDGLLDRMGRKKVGTAMIRHLWKKKKSVPNIPNIKIIKPAIPLTSRMEVLYTSVIEIKNKWTYPDEADVEDRLEWTLIKTDAHGNAIAIKELGKGSKIRFRIPEDYHKIKYELALSFRKDNLINIYKTKINTPLHSSMVP